MVPGIRWHWATPGPPTRGWLTAALLSPGLRQAADPRPVLPVLISRPLGPPGQLPAPFLVFRHFIHWADCLHPETVLETLHARAGTTAWMRCINSASTNWRSDPTFALSKKTRRAMSVRI